MNRPKIEDFPYYYSVINGIMYKDALEKYCDELEKALDGLAQQNYYLKKQVDILSRKLAKQSKVSISTIRGRMLWELEESEKQ